MSEFAPSPGLLEFIVDRINVGVFIVNQDLEVKLWNKFMAANSGVNEQQVVGKKLFDCFPDLPQRWFAKKVSSVFMLKNFAFTSWEQRPYLFPFRHNRPVTGGMEFMCQDLTLMPIKDEAGEVENVCIILFDVTDTAIYRSMHQAAMKKLEMVSRVDGLTQLFNRSHWQSRLVEEFSRAGRYQSPLTLIMFDLDHFKSVNDTHGHLGGDAVLVQVASLIKSALRDSDIAGRYGGEEFGILLTSTPLDGARVVAERLRASIESSPVPFEKAQIPVTASLGIAQFNPTIHDPEELIAHADAALYEAKAKGRNRVVVFEELVKT
ncbi:MAG: sensor domain-containing diguanylate cyclase [Gammaproteobacteria bacterium]|nr:sensor domain-containing diguanylate cyclase [Gammaproteobacteria bacterium]